MLKITNSKFRTFYGCFIRVACHVKKKHLKNLKPLSFTSKNVGSQTTAASHVGHDSSEQVALSSRSRIDVVICNWKGLYSRWSLEDSPFECCNMNAIHVIFEALRTFFTAEDSKNKKTGKDSDTDRQGKYTNWNIQGVSDVFTSWAIAPKL